MTPTASQLPEILACIEEPMASVDAWLTRQFEPDHPAIEPLLTYANRFRGKRVRAAQVLLVAQAFGKVTESHIAVAGIIEMIHAATLAHDDVLDEAQERRGLNCLHVEWGPHTSVLLGDWIYAKAFTKSTEFPDMVCAQVLAQATGSVCRGEIHQNLTRGDFYLSEEDYFSQIDGKTAALYEAAGRLAAYYSGAPQEVQLACARHGLLAGRAFQIIDDVLDLEGDQKQVGKSLGTDWARGKMTLPLIRLRNVLNEKDQASLELAFGSGQHRLALFEGLLGTQLRHQIAETKKEALDFLSQAATALDSLPESAARSALQELTVFLGTRRK
ncbi:MAG: polyprenyl synthetase family protein [Planctomycetota bacterium]|nr:polyprenyl synthetase family protein [Planctomycetota bacterium]